MPPSRPQECHCGPPDPAEWWAATEWCPCRPPPLCFQVSPSCHPTAVPKGSPGARVPPASRVGPPRPCPPQGQGAGTRGKSEPLQAGTAGTGSVGGWGQPGHGQLLGQVTPVPSVPWGTRAMGNPCHGEPASWETHAMGWEKGTQTPPEIQHPGAKRVPKPAPSHGLGGLGCPCCAPTPPSLLRPAEGEGECCPLPPRRPPASCQGHHCPCPLWPPPRAQRHPQGARPDPGGCTCTQR